MSYGGGAVVTLRRTSAPTAITLAVNAAGSQVFGVIQPKLGDVNTADLTPVFREYRVLKVIARFSKRIDPGNSGVTNQNTLLNIATACDPEAATPTSFTDVTAYNNHKHGILSADRTFTYTFYPKVTNSVGVIPGSTVSSVGYFPSNPWLQCSTGGVAVQMLSLLYAVKSTLTTDVSNLEYTLEYVFQVRGIA